MKARRRRVSIRPKAERFARRRRALCPGAKRPYLGTAPVVRREAPVLLPAVGGFPFGRRPKVLLAVGELFVRARSARSQARSACVIARRRLALPPRGTKTSTPTAEGRWGAANLSAKPKVRRPPQALAAKPLVYYKLKSCPL